MRQYSLGIICLLMALLLPVASYGDDGATQVKFAELFKQDQDYVLSAEINYQLSDRAMQALQNGVPLFWVIQVKLQQQRDYLWNKTLADLGIRYRIQYHALLNMYRVRNENTDAVYNFSTLAAALNAMSIRELAVIGQAQIEPERQYQVAIKVMLDRDALPLPLRPIAYTNPQWFLSSDWTLWPLVK